MKKLSIVFIGIVIVVISIFSEMVLSVIQEDDWSNFTHSWETKWTTPVNYKRADGSVAVNKITVCNARLLTNKN